MAKNFTINSKTGRIIPRKPFDFELLDGSNLENVRTIQLTARAKDFGTPPLYTDVPIFVYIQDVNDNVPQFEKEYYNATIPENTPSGTSILQIKAYDSDGSSPNNQIVYRIQKGASDKFTINVESGVISVARGASLDPDLTQPRTTSYSLNVLALDGASGEDQLQAEIVVNITILDVNNKSPIINDPGVINILENVPVSDHILLK